MTHAVCPLADQARRSPTACAILQDGRQLSFADLQQHVAALALYWRQTGIRPGQRVCFQPTGEWHDVALLFSLWRVAACACPLSPRFPPRLRQRMTEHVSADWCLEPSAVLEALERSRQTIAQGPDDVAWDTQRPATVVLTSGSTAAPKAVVHSLAAHLASALGARFNIPLQAGDRWLASLPVHHVGGLAIPIRTIAAGATLVVDPTRRSLAEKLARFGVTHVSLVSTQLRRLLAEPGFAPARLKAVLLGGSSYPASLVHDSLARSLPLFTSYGLTEMASQVTSTPPGSEAEQLMTAGKVLPGRELAIAADGEILVRGDTLCQGYLQDGVLSPVVDATGWFHTGDLGWLDADQRLHVTGRRDQMFISGGENIHPEEIEAALMSIPGIVQAIVVPIDDEEFGARPAAFVDAPAFEPLAWSSVLRECLPGFKVPRAFFPWPTGAAADVKPSRTWLRTLVK